MYDQIPVIELNDLRKINHSQIDHMGRSLCDIGFVAIRMPMISELLKNVFPEFKKVFDLSVDIKRKYEHKEMSHQIGWTPPFTEQALACKKIGESKEDIPDAKECWFIGPDELTGLDTTLSVIKEYPKPYHPNVWPAEVPTFELAMRSLYSVLTMAGFIVLRSLDIYFDFKVHGLESFEQMATNGPSRMRAICYPSLKANEVGKFPWACKHTDINLISILPSSTKQPDPTSDSGLWIRRRDGEWIPGRVPPDCVIAQVGDMAAHITSKKLLSAVHEVRAPKHANISRLSAALFIHPRPNVILDYEKMKTANQFLDERLASIGLS